MIGKYIKTEYFIISFAIGILYVYLVQPKKEIVYRFPNPNNLDKLQYIDKAENVFSFDYKKVKCPTDDSQIKDIPVQN